MKKIAAALFFLMTAAAFAEHYDREEHMIESKLYQNFPVLEAGKNINVDIERDGGVEVDIELARGSNVDTKNYKLYADKIADSLNEILKEMKDQNFTLRKIEIDTSGIHDDKEVFRY